MFQKVLRLFCVQWQYLPLTWMHTLSDAVLPGDDLFRYLRCILLKVLGLRIKLGSKFGRRITVSNYKNLTIGNHCFVNDEVYFDSYKKIVIGRECSIGFRSIFITANHRLRSDFISLRPIDGGASAPITVSDHVWIGAGVVILPGVMVGRGAVVAAGAVVTKDVEPQSVVAGVPARKIKDLR